MLSEASFGQFVQLGGSTLKEWWLNLMACQPRKRREALATLGIACCRSNWLERNGRNFEGKQTTEIVEVRRIRDEFQSWVAARQLADSREMRGIG